mmetsp:Transcript_16882/g.36809  ORF Transcript_16882/g.36809 Transcript_16882/m.36809 type:complete len:99 (+) Transcript_16882:101-397(+)
MMKFFSFLLLVSSVSAFMVAPKFESRTELFGRAPDPDFMNHLATDGEDAVRVVFQECDEQKECAIVEGVKQDDTWTFEEGIDTATNRKILMWEKEDTE